MKLQESEGIEPCPISEMDLQEGRGRGVFCERRNL